MKTDSTPAGHEIRLSWAHKLSSSGEVRSYRLDGSVAPPEQGFLEVTLYASFLPEALQPFIPRMRDLCEVTVINDLPEWQCLLPQVFKATLIAVEMTMDRSPGHKPPPINLTFRISPNMGAS